VLAIIYIPWCGQSSEHSIVMHKQPTEGWAQRHGSREGEGRGGGGERLGFSVMVVVMVVVVIAV